MAVACGACTGGTPAVPIMEFRRQVAHIKRLGRRTHQHQHQQNNTTGEDM